MTGTRDLGVALSGSGFERYVDLVDNALQLVSFIATALEEKPAMDLWVPAGKAGAFRRWCRGMGLLSEVDAYFDRVDPVLDRLKPEATTTTRAVWARGDGGAEAHMFVARHADRLAEARACGWYPLLHEGAIIEKHRLDHLFFGNALGYPECCTKFFLENDDWHRANLPYRAWQSTGGEPSRLSNGLLRHSALGLVPHLTCSFSCVTTQRRARQLRARLGALMAPLVRLIDEYMKAVFLVISERRVFRLQGEVDVSGVSIRYNDVMPVPPTRDDDPLLPVLRAADECHVDGPTLRFSHHARARRGVMFRSDRHGPECPFLLAAV